MVQSRLRCIVEWMPRVYGGSPGKPRSRSGSQFGKSALVYSRRIGCAEIVVNSDWRSGLFSRVGWRVFFSHACSLAEGSRCAEEVYAGGTVCVDPLECSLMRLSPEDGIKQRYKSPENSMLFQMYGRGKGGVDASRIKAHG